MDTEESQDDEGPGFQALHVEEGDDDFDLDIPPTSGNEYLRRVRMEASSCPKIVVADLDTKAFQNRQTVRVKQWGGKCYPAPKGFAPPLNWKKMQIASFAENRQKLARNKVIKNKGSKRKKTQVNVPLPNDVEGWCRLCFGRIQPPAALREQIEENSDEEESATVTSHVTTHDGILPLVSIVTAMDQPTVIKVLEYHLNWFEATGFTERQGYWFYALLLSLDKPLLPDACDLIRRLARACANLRASLDSTEDPRLIPLNLFITLISSYFDQTDLQDEVQAS